MAPPPPPPPSSISSYRPLRTSLCRPPRPPHLTSRTCPVSRTHSPPHPLLSILSSSASSSSSSPLQTQRHPPISSQIAQHFRRLSTSSTSSLPPRPPLFCLLLSLLLCTLLTSHQVHADRNRFYHISALCLRERVHPLYKKIDGAVISSKSENNLDCTITFQTDTILQKFMLRFEKLALDCDDHLYIYDGAHTHGSHKAHLSCRSTRAEVGTIYTAGNFLTLHYTTDAYSKADNGFRLIITAFKDSKNYCREHRCANQFCISRDLVCDGVNHCADNSDESYFASCQEFEPEDTIIGLEPLYFITLVVVVFLACLVLVITVSFCLCRRERLLARQQQRIALQQQYGTHPLMLDGIGGHTGATPILQHNSSYNSKLDGCTMITSLDGYGATRNGGLVNSFTHTTLQNSHQAGANFATLPHLHHNHATTASPQHGSQSSSVAATSGSPHVRFGTLPVRGGGGNEKPPPPYPGSYFNAIGQQQQGQQGHGQIALGPMNGGPANGNGILVNGSNGLVHHTSQQQNAGGPVQTQVIYTAK